jgi:hypothetical protein
MCNWELLPLLRVHIHVYLYMYDFHRKMFFLDYTYPFFLLEKVRLTILFTLSSYTDVLFTAVCSYEQILVHWIGSCGVVSHAPSPRGQWAERPAPAAPPCARTHHRTNAKTKLMAAGRAEHDCTRPGSCLYARPDFLWIRHIQPPATTTATGKNSSEKRQQAVLSAWSTIGKAEILSTPFDQQRFSARTGTGRHRQLLRR